MKMSDLSKTEQSDIASTLNGLADLCSCQAVEHGFWDRCSNDGEKIALMHSELSELLERLRSNEPRLLDEHCPAYENREIELADLLIRALDFAGYYGYRIGEALVAKLLFNESRPYRHGKRF